MVAHVGPGGISLAFTDELLTRLDKIVLKEGDLWLDYFQTHRKWYG